ncbi:hypothetical protein GCM10009558_016740 [Virgisporangium aurantiacum]
MLRFMPRTLLRGGVVLDVRAGATSVADVVVEGDRIVDVGVGLDGDDSVDCTGHLLVPGFIDCHTHLVAHDFVGDDFFETARSMRVLCAVPVLTTLLRLGVTTVRDAWGADAGLKRAVELGWIDGPEVLISLRQVCTTGGIGDLWSPRIGPVDPLGDPGMPDPVFDGVDAARAVGLADRIGSIEVGKRADLLLLDGLSHLTGGGRDLAGAVVSCLTPSNVRTVLVDGEIVKRDGHLVTHDLAALRAEAAAICSPARAGRFIVEEISVG